MFLVSTINAAHILGVFFLPSLAKQPSKCHICGGGVLRFNEKQFFLIILIFNLDSHYKMLLSYTY